DAPTGSARGDWATYADSPPRLFQSALGVRESARASVAQPLAANGTSCDLKVDVGQSCKAFASLRSNGDRRFTWWTSWVRYFLICTGQQACVRRMQDSGHTPAKLSTDSCCEVVTELVDARWMIYGVLVLFLLVSLSVVLCSYRAGMRRKPTPPKYWNLHPLSSQLAPCGTLTHWWRRWRYRFRDKYHWKVDVTDECGAHVQALFDCRSDADRMGKGNDGKWVKHNKFVVEKVWRIENGKLSAAYARARASIHSVERQPPAVTDAGVGRKRPRPLRVLLGLEAFSEGLRLAAQFERSLDLQTFKNEVLLFHGCPGKGARDPIGRRGTRLWLAPEEPSPVDAVCKQGFDDRLGKLEGMLGSGTYFADMVSKADCYSGKYNPLDVDETDYTHPDYSHATMFLARVTLGTPYVAEQPLEGLRRPPCYEGHFDTNVMSIEVKHAGSKPWTEKGLQIKLCDHGRFDSVITDRRLGSGRLWNEYVIYGKQAYPEFQVQYRRAKAD
ncbi:unnamed protein product, partial [Prorocentrum cordatum]